MILPASRTYAGWLAIARILTGAVWIIHAIPKFLNGASFLPPNGRFSTYVQQGIASTSGPYHDFMVGVVAPNAAIFAELVRLGELLVGISLVLGLFTRLGAFFGVLLPLNYMAARGAVATLSGWGSADATLALLGAISLILPTGRVAGFDGLRTPRAPRRPKVIAEVVPERPLDRPTAPP
ncbi:MAG: DoxX family protein [Candidatus Eremiobacteraeota bacterium]|nr:DoxX family protein [Candidatus Eremiobacteraeota bacterium]